MYLDICISRTQPLYRQRLDVRIDQSSLSKGDRFQDSHQIPEDSTKPMYIIVFPYIYICMIKFNL